MMSFRKITVSRSLLLLLVSSLFTNFAVAASYYWRAVAADKYFTNISNWETGPGSGLSPATAPSAADDVFFPVASNMNNVVFNNGNCHDFTVSAPSPATFTFSGTMNQLAGSLICNGQQTFTSSPIINFVGTGSHTINTGTAAPNLAAGTWNFSGPGTGTYTLAGPLNVAATFNLSGQSFNTAGYDFTMTRLNISGSKVRTIDLSNSLITFSSILDISSPNATTTYIGTNTKLVGQSSTSTYIALGDGVRLSVASLTFNASGTGTNYSMIYLTGQTLANRSILNLNDLYINTAHMHIGQIRTDYAGGDRLGVLNVSNITFQQPASIFCDGRDTINVGTITEAPSCKGQSAIVGEDALVYLNSSAPITTSGIAYYGVVFGGSGVNAGSSSNDLGLNTGAVTWTAAATGSSFWWVGGTGNWNDPTKWSIAGSGGAPQTAAGCLPTVYDNVFFDGNSFSTGTQTVTIPSGVAWCKNLDWSAATATNYGLLTSSATTYLMINGSANFSKARGVVSPLVFIGKDSHTISSGSLFSYASPDIFLKGLGTYTLSDDFVTGVSSTVLHHNAGTFNTAGKKVDVATFVSTSMPFAAANTRTLDISNSEFIEETGGGSAGSVFTIDLSYLSTLNAANSHYKLKSTTYPQFKVLCKSATAPYLATAAFNDISFLSNPVANLEMALNGTYAVSFNNVTFTNSANIINSSVVTHTVNNYNLAGGYTYRFNGTFNVTGGIHHVISGCEELVLIQGYTAGTQAKIYKAAAPFDVNGAYIKDINATGATLNVIGGVDDGNNTNVTASTGTGRIMYWVGNTGNWSDGANHWSIGLSGGDPTVTNPLGCVPRVLDSVVFDLNSFSVPAQTVTLDVTGNCKGMNWTNAAGAQTPIFAGGTSMLLNNYGCLRLAGGMSSPFSGSIYMNGAGTDVNQNFIEMNGVTTNASVYLAGGGRYDLKDSVRIINNQKGIILTKGNFIANGNKIYAGILNLTVTNGNKADISNCFIELTAPSEVGGKYPYEATHNALGGSTWNAAGSTIKIAGSGISISNTAPVTYNNIISTSPSGAKIYGRTTNRITFRNVLFQNPGTTGVVTLLSGVFTMDTLQYTPYSTNTLQPGGSNEYVVNNALIAYGTPCTPTYIRSANLGTAAILKRSTCNTDLNFVNIRDINTVGCTAAENKVIGTDEGGNTNWTFTSIPALTKLGPDTTILCNHASYNQNASGFGTIPGMTYLWNTGSTADNIDITTAGTYSVTVTYGPACAASDSRAINFSSFPPVAIAAYEQVSPSNCTFGAYTYYEGATASNTNDKAILAINPNGNVLTPASITINNEGDLEGGGDTFTNTGNGYYQSTDGINTVRISKRLHSINAPGSYTVNGGVIVRVYYTAADTISMLTDAWPGAASTGYKGWFLHSDLTAQDVVNSMQPNYMPATPITPLAWGTEGGVMYAEFLLTSLGTIGYRVITTGVPLPLQLLSFDAYKMGDYASLSWATASETGIRQFNMQRSADGQNWTTIGTVAAQGSNSRYNIIDKQPLKGNNLYRLQVADATGPLSYSPIRTLNFGAPENVTFTLYPNPARHQVNLRFSNELKGTASLQVHNSMGQLMISRKITQPASSFDMNISQLPAGIYVVSVKTAENSYIQRLIVE